MAVSGSCPFHDMPPGDTVHVQVGECGPTYPRTAQRCCDDWHTAKALEPLFAKADRAIAAWLDEYLPQECDVSAGGINTDG